MLSIDRLAGLYTYHGSQFLLPCSIPIVKRGVVSPTLNIEPTLFVIPCNFWGRLHVYSVAVTQVIIHPDFNHP